MHVYGSFENFRRFSMHVLGSQTDNFLSQKGQRSFCLNCEVQYDRVHRILATLDLYYGTVY